MSWEKVENDIASGPFGLLKWALVLLVIVVGVGFALRPASMATDRVVMKNSFQYKEGMAQRGAILEANLLEVELALKQDPSSENLKAQQKVLRAQINAISINK